MLEPITLGPLSRAQFDQAVEWAAAEGWNPGLYDADVFWESDPEGYLGAFDATGELIATGSVVSYGGRFGFMGFFIVRKDLRGQGIGTRLWIHRRDHLRSRLHPDAAIGMDGVFAMQDWYRRGGFEFTHRNLRMQGTAVERTIDRTGLVDLATRPLADLVAFDAAHFGVERPEFIEQWIRLPESRALGRVRDDALVGLGVIRRCREGHKIGPLFAADPDVAEQLFTALTAEVAGETIVLDTPEIHDDAMALARDRGLSEFFGCARMYYGPAPATPWERIYGVTTFELG